MTRTKFCAKSGSILSIKISLQTCQRAGAQLSRGIFDSTDDDCDLCTRNRTVDFTLITRLLQKYWTMANFYDYYVSNALEEMDGQKKTFQGKINARDNPVSNGFEEKNLLDNDMARDYHALNNPEEIDVPTKAFQRNDKAKDPEGHGRSPEGGTSVPIQRDGKATIGWRGYVGDNGKKAGELKGGSEGGNGKINGGGWVDKAVDDCSHVYSDGTSVNSLFDTRQDKIAAMNMIAILAYSYNVRILVQQVMTTHVHSIVSGTAWDRERFARELRRRLIIWATDKRHSVNGAIMVGNDEIRTERELMNKFMYVYRNAIAAGYPGMPWEYVGGPGDIFFKGHMAGGRPVGELSVRERRATFHTRLKIPEDWLFNEEGLILPRCYVDRARVERLFKSPKVFIAFMSQSKKTEAEIDMECSREYLRVAKESELRSEGKELFMNMFGKASASRASLEERLAVAGKLWGDKKTFSLSSLSRVTLVPQGVLESIFGKRS